MAAVRRNLEVLVRNAVAAAPSAPILVPARQVPILVHPFREVAVADHSPEVEDLVVVAVLRRRRYRLLSGEYRKPAIPR